MLEHYKEYSVPLLRLLADLPGGEGTRAEVSLPVSSTLFHGDEMPEEHFESMGVHPIGRDGIEWLR